MTERESKPSEKRGATDWMSGIMVICAVIVTFLAVRRSSSAAPAQEAAAPAQKTLSSAEFDELASKGIPMGAEKGDVRVVEFADFQCPFCAIAQVRLDSLMTAHPGRVMIKFRHLPLEKLHPVARFGAFVAECATEKGKGEKFVIATLTPEPEVTKERIELIASQLGLTSDDLSKCARSKEIKARVDADAAVAASMGWRSTPTFVVNGEVIHGTQAVSVIDSLIGARQR